jgi:hypothetical protein
MDWPVVLCDDHGCVQVRQNPDTKLSVALARRRIARLFLRVQYFDAHTHTHSPDQTPRPPAATTRSDV